MPLVFRSRGFGAVSPMFTFVDPATPHLVLMECRASCESWLYNFPERKDRAIAALVPVAMPLPQSSLVPQPQLVP